MRTQLQTPEEIRAQIWQELVRASKDRHHAWRTPVLATTTGEGNVNARTVVLRKVDQQARHIELYTDGRSPKVAELNQHSNACFVFWSARLNWQLRVQADISVLTSGSYVEDLWKVVKQSKSAGDYLGLAAPGTSLKSGQATAALNATSTILATTEAESVGAFIKDAVQKSHFSVLRAHFKQMDWLELGGPNHRRARLAGDAWEWLEP